MWQRFTERARKVIFYAQQEAQDLGEGHVSTEHILLGLLREEDSTATQILESLGVSLGDVRDKLMSILPKIAAWPSNDMTLTPRAKRVIDLAYDEARNLNNDYIGTEHLLLGLTREGDGLAGRVLASLGVGLEEVRRITMALQDKEIGTRRPGDSEEMRSKAKSSPVSARRVMHIFGSVLHGLISRMAADPPDHLVHSSALVAFSSAKPLAAGYLVLMALQSPSDELTAALDAMGTNASDLAGVIMASFANFQDEVDTPSIPLNELLNQALSESNALRQEKLLDAHLVLAALHLRAPMVESTFRAAGITAERMRASMAAPESE